MFLAQGYAEAGVTDLAAAGDVSRSSIYRYFPAGRPDLYLAVTEDLLSELHERLRYAAGVPFSPARRMEQVLAALFAFFEENPEAYRFLFRDVWVVRDEGVAASALAARAQLAAEVAGIVADTAAPPRNSPPRPRASSASPWRTSSSPWPARPAPRRPGRSAAASRPPRWPERRAARRQPPTGAGGRRTRTPGRRGR